MNNSITNMSRAERKRLASVVVLFLLLFVATQLGHSRRGFETDNFVSLVGGDVEQQSASAAVGVLALPPPPKIVWLMSFPNSGTSYTLALVRRVSNSTMGTNYGSEHKDAEGNSLLIHPDYRDGPFRTSHRYELPVHYILTKTHCLGYCVTCHPEGYVVSQSAFELGCRTGKMLTNHGLEEPEEHAVRYSLDLVHGAVHLWRNPFDNVVSRFHLAYQKRRKSLNPKFNDWLYEHPQTPAGLLRWCSQMDGSYKNHQERYFDPKVIRAFRKVPCHSEFFRYVHWHNNALSTIRRLNLTTHTVYYEDYGRDYRETLGGLMNFLELPYVGHNMKFKGSNYTDYYTESQRKEVAIFIKKLASKETYKMIAIYLDDYLPLELLI